MRETPQISAQELAAALGLTRQGIEWQIQQLKSRGWHRLAIA